MGQKVVQKVENHCFWGFWTHFWITFWRCKRPRIHVFSKISVFYGFEKEGPKCSKNDLFSLFLALFSTLFELGKCRNDQKMGQKVEILEKVEKSRKIDDFWGFGQIQKKLVEKSDFLEGSKKRPIFWWFLDPWFCQNRHVIWVPKPYVFALVKIDGFWSKNGSIFGPRFWTPQKWKLSSRVSTPPSAVPIKITCFIKDLWHFWPKSEKMAKTAKTRQKWQKPWFCHFLDHFWSILDKTDQNWSVFDSFERNPFMFQLREGQKGVKNGSQGYPCLDPIFGGIIKEPL